MKTQNTLKNKTKFFFQYFNSEAIWRTSELDENIDEVTWEFKNFKYLNETDYLELKPLSQISDEDAIHGLKLIISSRNSSAFDYCKSQNYSIEQMVNYFNRHLVYDFKLILTDYLRSKGYALPYMDLSVEDLIEYGWVKLKEN